MNKNIRRILLLLTIPFVGLLLKELLLFVGLNEDIIIYDFISKILIRCVLAIIVLYLIIKWGYGTFLKQFKNILISGLILLPIVYFSFQHVQYEIDNAELTIGFVENILYFTSTFATGLYEELLFRILGFSLIFNYFKNKKENLFKSVILTSLLFGIAHFINLFKITSFTIIIQVLIAMGFGLLLQSLLLRFKNIFIVIIIHTLINYLGMYRYYLGFPASINEVDDSSGFIGSLIWTIIILVCFVIPLSYLILKPVIRNR
ncbi:CPBP family intramembrane glutamic endopeptidase [Croceibacter atlanticus]|uniref:CPBP family intramembrane glutamic endopeptidase n=1 Tax=Croceibacter atlanticus TaxID=313588 RepID=UPI0030F94387